MTSATNSMLNRREFVPTALRGAAAVLAAALFAAPSRSQQSDRVKALGAKLFCACSCGQILTACNHVGCTYSTKMLQELNDRIARGDSDDVILQSFVQEYGQTVLAEPPAKGFNVLVWVLPVVLPIVALVFGWGMVQRWRERASLTPASAGVAVNPELLARVHRDAGDSDE
jgi:cytochrome c-type biogenesis protein CcmH/NrfF